MYAISGLFLSYVSQRFHENSQTILIFRIHPLVRLDIKHLLIIEAVAELHNRIEILFRIHETQTPEFICCNFEKVVAIESFLLWMEQHINY